MILHFKLIFAGLGGLWWRHGRDQRAMSHTQAQLDLPMGLASIALLAAALNARSALVPPGFTPWLVLVALLPALPCLTGAWNVLRG